MTFVAVFFFPGCVSCVYVEVKVIERKVTFYKKKKPEKERDLDKLESRAFHTFQGKNESLEFATV